MDSIFEMSHGQAAGDGGTSQTVSISTTSAQSTAMPAGTLFAIVYVSAGCFYRRGSNPTALNTGADAYLVSGNQYRLPIGSGEKFAFITASGTGTVYITPGA